MQSQHAEEHRSSVCSGAPCHRPGRPETRWRQVAETSDRSGQPSFLILQVSKETGRATEEVQEEASAILEEMAQCLQLSTVRFFAFTLSKIFKTLFRSICVNEDGIQRVNTQIRRAL